MDWLFCWLRARLAATDGEAGQDFAEYSLLLALIAVVAAAALTTLGGAIVSGAGRLLIAANFGMRQS
jgi:Flp pilus assembly pilin Flp